LIACSVVSFMTIVELILLMHRWGGDISMGWSGKLQKKLLLGNQWPLMVYGSIAKKGVKL